MAATDDLDALQRIREEKIRQIAEKRKQVEDLKRRRAEREAEIEVKPKGEGMLALRMAEASSKEKLKNQIIEDEMGRSVESLIHEILSGAPPVNSKRVSPEGPLKELKEHTKEIVEETCAADRALQFRQEFSVAAVSIDPRSREVYARGVQTDLTSPDLNAEPHAESSKLKTTSIIARLADKARRAVHPDEQMPEPAQKAGGKLLVPASASQSSSGPKGASAARTGPAQGGSKPLSHEERDRVESHPEFQKFFQRASLIVERTLGQQAWDVAADIFGDAEAEGENPDVMKYIDDYVDDQSATRRPVTDVRFSPRRAEIFLASYGNRTNAALRDPAGCMLVWNLAMKNRPELTFTSSSAVLTAHFHNSDPWLFYGGCYSGAVLLWDARAGHGAVMRSPLSGKGHSHPVQAMQLVGTQNATNLISASNDGRLCVWSLAMFGAPADSIDLRLEAKKRDLAVMALSFPRGETNTLYVGAEDGTVCEVHIHGSKVGVTEVYEAHEGPVTGIDMHPAAQPSESSSGLALSSSFDWSVKLWKVREHQAPVLSFDAFDDYVLDVKWHPIHPAVFTTVDAEGHVDLWNLNQSTENPVVRADNPRRLALNRCHWSKDGRQLVTGDSEGTLSMYMADRSLAEPRTEDILQFQERVRPLEPVVPKGTRDAAPTERPAGTRGAAGDPRH